MTIFAIDPGPTHSGYALLKTIGGTVTALLAHGKEENPRLRRRLAAGPAPQLFAIEMIAHYGKNMHAGATTFETCVWIGRLLETAEQRHGLVEGSTIRRVYRRDEKINLCGSMAARDADIKTALQDRFAPGVPNHGKGHKAAPGFFYGVAADAWQAIATGVTAFDLYGKEMEP